MFGGRLPECISNLSNAITVFNMDNNNIVGRTPEGLGNLINLEVLAAGGNELSGSIPSTIGELQKLRIFALDFNSISGSIPTSLGNLTMLIRLRLNNNNLRGQIPPSLGKCENLILLDLSNNNLSGTIPSQIVGLSSLSIFLNLSSNTSVAIDGGCALEYLHRRCETPIVHCDLKPSNILLDEEMIGHVGNFGIAKFITSDMQNNTSSLSSSLGFRGTIGYAPPEYGMGSSVTTYGDVCSYGILLLEMFTGRRPTDEMFIENMNLHNFVESALPNRVADITDPTLLQETMRS